MNAPMMLARFDTAEKQHSASYANWETARFERYS